MSFRRVGWVATIALATLLEISCGQVYRPVVIPVNTTPPNSANFHAVFGISANVPLNPGAALQIDVSGDTDIGQASMGVNPTHAAIFPNNARVFVANAGASLCAGGTDSVTAFFPAGDSATTNGLGTTTTFTVPNIGTSQASSITAISEAGNLVSVSLSAPITTANRRSADRDFRCRYPRSDACRLRRVLPHCLGQRHNHPILEFHHRLAGGYGWTCHCSNVLSLPSRLRGSHSKYHRLRSQLRSRGRSELQFREHGFCHGAQFVDELDHQPCLPSRRGASRCHGPDSQWIRSLRPQPGQQYGQRSLSLRLVDPGHDTGGLLPRMGSCASGQPAECTSSPRGMRRMSSQLYTINTATNAVIPQSPQSVGAAGANFVLFDKSRNRLYVTNPNAGAVYVFDATTDPPTPLGSSTGKIGIPAPPIPANTPPCRDPNDPCRYTQVAPVSVAALPDGSRFYVASYVTAAPATTVPPVLPPSPCPDSIVTATGCVIPQVTVFDAASLTIKTTIFPLLPPVTTSTGTVSQFAVAPAAFCAPATSYTPAVARFRMSAVAAADGSRVYASLCDGGSVAIVNTTTSSIATGGTNTPDTLVTDLLAPFSAAPAQSGQEPPPQNPVFLLIGQ